MTSRPPPTPPNIAKPLGLTTRVWLVVRERHAIRPAADALLTVSYRYTESAPPRTSVVAFADFAEAVLCSDIVAAQGGWGALARGSDFELRPSSAPPGDARSSSVRLRSALLSDAIRTGGAAGLDLVAVAGVELGEDGRACGRLVHFPISPHPQARGRLEACWTL